MSIGMSIVINHCLRNVGAFAELIVFILLYRFIRTTMIPDDLNLIKEAIN